MKSPLWSVRSVVRAAVVVVLATATVVVTETGASATDRLVCPVSVADAAGAGAVAAQCGRDVAIDSMRSETQSAVARPDGRVTVTKSLGQVRFRNGAGAWTDVDLTLVRRGDGTVAPRAHPNGLVLSGGGWTRSTSTRSP